MTTFGKSLVLGALLAILFFAAAAAGGLYGRFVQTNKARVDNKAAWHAVVCDIESQVIDAPKASASDKRDAIKFYDGILTRDIHTTGCGLQTGGKK